VSALSTVHTRTLPGRYNAATPVRPSHEVLYLAPDHFVGLFEVEALVGSPPPEGTYFPNPNASWIILNVHVQLARVIDLSDPAAHEALETSFQELTGDWRGYRRRPQVPPLKAPYWTNVPTQRLGHALFRVRGLEGFLAPSSRDSTKSNLMVFPEKLRPHSFIRFRDAQTGAEYALP